MKWPSQSGQKNGATTDTFRVVKELLLQTVRQIRPFWTFPMFDRIAWTLTILLATLASYGPMAVVLSIILLPCVWGGDFQC
jgi:hypothetical protein